MADLVKATEEEKKTHEEEEIEAISVDEKMMASQTNSVAFVRKTNMMRKIVGTKVSLKVTLARGLLFAKRLLFQQLAADYIYRS